jgi:hypothetical protein
MVWPITEPPPAANNMKRFYVGRPAGSTTGQEEPADLSAQTFSQGRIPAAFGVVDDLEVGGRVETENYVPTSTVDALSQNPVLPTS